MKGRTILLCLAGAGVILAAVFLAPSSREAEAGYSSDTVKELVSYLEGDAAFNLKLQALDALRKKTDTGVESDLEKLAKGDDVKLAIFVTTALGKKGTADAKKKLKSLLENGDLDIKVRIGAMSAIAYHWKDSGDLTYLEKKSKGNTTLSSRYAWLKKHVYGK